MPSTSGPPRSGIRPAGPAATWVMSASATSPTSTGWTRRPRTIGDQRRPGQLSHGGEAELVELRRARRRARQFGLLDEPFRRDLGPVAGVGDPVDADDGEVDHVRPACLASSGEEPFGPGEVDVLAAARVGRA